MNIKQIAKEANVSVATVSRVLNHPENVAASTREKIQKVMEEAGYKPNWFAQGLNFNTTKTIGIIVPHILNSSYMEIVKGVEDVAMKKGFITFIGNGEMNPQIESDYIDQLEKRRVDGIIILFSSLDTEKLKNIESKGVPLVLIGAHEEEKEFNIVRLDCKIAAESMVKHLLSCGHRRIALLQGIDPYAESIALNAGYRKALTDSGQTIEESLIMKVENTIEGGYLGAKKMMAENKFDVFFCTSDNIAFGAMDAMKDAGVRIPDEIALAGFGNFRMSNMIDPKLTTVEVPFHKMGVYGARLLFDLIESDDNQKANRKAKAITLHSKLKVRKSCGHKERIGEMF